MSATPIYVKTLKLKNIRTFSEEVELNLEKKDGTLSQWTLILGDNSIGKSTLLQCIAWMKPYSGDNSGIGISITKDMIEPWINDEENETLERLVRKGIDTDKQSTLIRCTFIADRKVESSKSANSEKNCFCEMNIWIDKESKLKDVKHKFDTNSEDIFLKNEVTIFGYSASRVLGKANSSDPSLDDTVPAFLADSTVLYDAEEILHTVNYAALGAKAGEKKRYNSYLEEVKRLLVSVLPDFETIDGIEISTPRLVGKQMKQGEITISTKHGKKIPFSDFSLGYKTVMSLVVDLSWRLFNKYPKSNNALHEPAIVLIDEIDLHLHPLWQRQIINNLSNHFKNCQFIATAHSPLMVQSAINENHAVLKFEEAGVEVINEPEGIDGWRVDQILTSEFFGLKTSRSIEYEKLIDERDLLLKKKKLSKKEKNELDILNKKLEDLPEGENREEIENRKFISEIVEKVKNKNIKIEA